MSFVCGLDLGQAADYTALVVAEQIEAADGNHHAVRHLERFNLGTSYPQVVRRVTDLLQTAPLNEQTPLVLDATGCGRPIADMFYHLSELVRVIITAGDQVTYDGGFTRVPKRDLVGAVQRLLQEGRLKFADLPLRDTLVSELRSFKAKITDAANDTYGCWREGQHDDLVLALALAVWWAERPMPSPPVVMLGSSRRRDWDGWDRTNSDAAALLDATDASIYRHQFRLR
jgi:hypothetical protein